MLRVKKIMRENAFEQKKKNLAKLTFNQKTIEKHLQNSKLLKAGRLREKYKERKQKIKWWIKY